MKLVAIQLTLTESQINALTSIKRGEVKGWGWPDDVGCQATCELLELGLVGTRGTLTHAGELVISAAGLESVVNQ